MAESSKPVRLVAPVLEKMHQFLLWLIPTVDKFPRAQKFLLGDRIQSTALKEKSVPKPHCFSPHETAFRQALVLSPHAASNPGHESPSVS